MESTTREMKVGVHFEHMEMPSKTNPIHKGGNVDAKYNAWACFGLWSSKPIVIYDGIRRRARHLPRAPHRNWDMERDMTLTRMFGTSDRICRDLLRMKIGPFERLCARLKNFGLVDSKSVRVEEQVAIFLNTSRARPTSGQTVSYYFHRVLHACLGLYREVVTNATIHNSPYEKDNLKPWYSYFQVRCS
ncbi:uncharacterized protein Fot_12821 [Forsythia ovata]|uniref:DUF8040 domain-containing protein n=1 Tax=Forsythia ovata TaxID=205694 RepID=A0ABD1W4A0_9LAMI